MSPNASQENQTTLFLPPLEFGPIKHSIGNIRHIVNSGGLKEILNTQEFKTSPRLKEKLYTLSDGQKIIITNKRRE